MKILNIIKGLIKVPLLYELFVLISAVADVIGDVAEGRRPTESEIQGVLQIIHPKLSKGFKENSTLGEWRDFVLAAINLYITGKLLLRK